MKRTICLLLTALMTVGMLAGCRKTPETPLVVGKNSDMLIEKAQTGSASTKKLSAIDVPANYTADSIDKGIFLSMSMQRLSFQMQSKSQQRP